MAWALKGSKWLDASNHWFLDNQMAELYQQLQKEYKKMLPDWPPYTPGEEVVLQLYADLFFEM